MLEPLRTFFLPYKRHFRETLKIAWPVIIGLMGFNIMGLIDSLMIGELSYIHLSAASLANGMFIVLTIIGMGLTFALSPLVAEADTAGKHRRVGDILRQGTYVTLILSIILTVLTYFASDALYFMDQPMQDVELADGYLRILSLTVIPLLVFMAFKQFTDGLSFTRPAMYVTLLGLAVNTFANWLLIFGHWGLPRMELAGAGWGTLISRIVMMVVMIGYVLYARDFEKYGLRQRWQKIQPRLMGRITELGLPSGFQHFFEVAAFVGCTVVIGWMDDPSASRAAHQIVLQLAAVTFMVVLGFSAASTIRVGQALGRKDQPNLRRSGFAGIMLSIGFMSISGLVFMAGKSYFPTFFNDNSLVLEISAKLMIMAAFFQIFDGIQAVGIGILRGIQDVKIPTVITFVAYWVIALPMAYVLGISLDMGVIGVWIGLVASLMTAAALLTMRFNHLTRSKAITEEISLEKEAVPEPVNL